MSKVVGSCPKQGSGQYYVCQGNTTEFVGCCTIDPCADGSGNCPSNDLGYTSFNADSYDDILPQTCVSTGLWYTCKYTPTAFMGCCLTNPCAADGCFGNNITAAMLSTNTTDAAPFMASSNSAPASDNDDPSVSTGGIVGIAIGSAVGALILGIILFTVYKRLRNKKEESQVLSALDPDGTPGMYMPSPYQSTKPLPKSTQSINGNVSDLLSGSTGFPSPPYNGGFDKDPSFPYPNSPGQVGQRPPSVAASWFSGATSQPAHSNNPSISSVGSQGGLHMLYSQQRPQQHLNTVSEMDNTQVARPLSELPGSMGPIQEHHVYGVGYNRVATAERRP